MIFLGHLSPMASRSLQRWEYAHETVIYLCTLYQLCFTDFVVAGMGRDIVGICLIITMCLHFLVSVAAIMLPKFRLFYLKLRNHWRHARCKGKVHQKKLTQAANRVTILDAPLFERPKLLLSDLKKKKRKQIIAEEEKTPTLKLQSGTIAPMHTAGRQSHEDVSNLPSLTDNDLSAMDIEKGQTSVLKMDELQEVLPQALINGGQPLNDIERSKADWTKDMVCDMCRFAAQTEYFGHEVQLQSCDCLLRYMGIEN